MPANLIGLVIGCVPVGIVVLILARHHWRMERTGETIRQTFLLAGVGLAIILAPIVGFGLAMIVAPTVRDSLVSLSMLLGMAIVAGSYAFGRLVEKRYDRVRSIEENDYLDPELIVNRSSTKSAENVAGGFENDSQPPVRK